MTTDPPLSNATDSPLPFALSGVPAKSKRGEGLGVRSVTMFAAGVGTLEGLKVGKLVEQGKDV